MEPGTKVAIISKSAEGVTHVAPSEKAPSKAASEPAPAPAEKEKAEKQTPKAETAAPKEKPKAPPVPPSRPSASEPQLPPKERERRVSFRISNYFLKYIRLPCILKHNLIFCHVGWIVVIVMYH